MPDTDKPTATELGAPPDNWTTRDQITVDKLLEAVQTMDHPTKTRVAEHFKTKSYRGMFERSLTEAKKQGLLEGGHGKPLQVTRKGRKKM